jgi:disulfide bond formation protein DsbB
MRRLAILLAVLALVAAACGGSDDDGASTETTAGSGGGSGNVAAGETFYQGTCATCHGPDAEGIDGLGKDLHNNTFIQSNTDDQMVAFLKVGRPASDPANTTGVDMPPKGGNPSLSDADLLDIVAFLDTLQ